MIYLYAYLDIKLYTRRGIVCAKWLEADNENNSQFFSNLSSSQKKLKFGQTIYNENTIFLYHSGCYFVCGSCRYKYSQYCQLVLFEATFKNRYACAIRHNDGVEVCEIFQKFKV